MGQGCLLLLCSQLFCALVIVICIFAENAEAMEISLNGFYLEKKVGAMNLGAEQDNDKTNLLVPTAVHMQKVLEATRPSSMSRTCLSGFFKAYTNPEERVRLLHSDLWRFDILPKPMKSRVLQHAKAAVSKKLEALPPEAKSKLMNPDITKEKAELLIAADPSSWLTFYNTPPSEGRSGQYRVCRTPVTGQSRKSKIGRESSPKTYGNKKPKKNEKSDYFDSHTSANGGETNA